MARPLVDAHHSLARRAGREAEHLAGDRIEPGPLEVHAVFSLDRGVPFVGFAQLLCGHSDEPAVDIHEFRHVNLQSLSVAGGHLGCHTGECRCVRHRSNDRRQRVPIDYDSDPMPTERTAPTFISPVLVGRDELLERADRAIAGLRDGTGGFLLLAGEAGIGKTRLLGAVGRRAGLAGIPAVGAASFPGDVELAGGLLIDLARDLARHEQPAGAADAGRRLEARLTGEEPDPTGGDAHRQRRLLVLDTVDLLAALASGGPVVFLLEDLHWADELSLEILAQLARRQTEVPILVIATYRSDEVFGRLPMRDWRTRLLTGRLAIEFDLPRLTRAEVATMAGALLGLALPVPVDVLDALEVRCDGIPLHVEEFLGAIGAGSPSGDDLRTRPAPATLAEAVVRRAETLSPEARSVADAGAVVGREFDLQLLMDVTGLSSAAVDAAITDLIERHFLVRVPEPGRFDFRHALIRDALHEAISDGTRRDVHRRIALAATGRPEIGSEAFLSMQYAGALMGEEAYRLARSAGRRAAALSSHREAVELFERVRRFTPLDATPAERAENFVALGVESAAIDENAAADDAFARARSTLEAAGDSVAAAAVVVPHVAVRHLLGDDLATRTTMLTGALRDLDGAAIPIAHLTRAALEAGLAAAYMLDRRLDESIEHAQRALSIARELRDTNAEIDASTTLGAVYVFAGRMDDGWALLESAVERARDAKLEFEAARAYRMLASGPSVLVEYERAGRWLREGIDYARRVELWNHHHYMTSHLAHVRWATGEWSEAQRFAEHALADGRGGITTRITSLHVLGYVAMGRAEWAAAAGYLDEARELGERMSELQRLSPALWGLAELAGLRGDHGAAIARCEEGMTASERVRDSAYAFPFLMTGVRALLHAGDPHAAERWFERAAARVADRSIPGTLPSIDHGRGLVLLARGATGQAREALETARAGWAGRNRSWDATRATIDLARCAARANRRVEAERFAAEAREAARHIGATALIGEGERVLGPARRGRPPEPWAPLTAREFEVARCVAEGLTNPVIAERLAVAPKTVAAHVEHILAKLGVNRRTEIAAWTATRLASQRQPAVLHSRPHGDDREE